MTETLFFQVLCYNMSTMEIKKRIAGMVVEDGKLLMLRGKNHPELWTPGGKVDEGESDEECLKRELMEEMGVELVEANFFREYSSPSFYNPTKFTTLQRVYITKIKGELVPAMEIKDHIWLTKDDFYNGKYPMIDITKDKILPDLIKEGIW